MERKTTIHAEDDRHDLLITRDFDLPVELLFTAHTDPDIIEQWMGSTAVVFEPKKHGRWQLEKRDENNVVVFGASGVFHEVIPNHKIIRTFEMLNAPFDVQLEFLAFEKLADDRSRLSMQIVYRTVALRDQMLKLPFAYGLNMAHDRLQQLLGQ